MKAWIHIRGPVEKDPDLIGEGILTLERSDGRSVWRQRLQLHEKIEAGEHICYVMVPVDA